MIICWHLVYKPEFVGAKSKVNLAFVQLFIDTWWLNKRIFTAYIVKKINVCQWSGRPGFNPWSSHTKDWKNVAYHSAL